MGAVVVWNLVQRISTALGAVAPVYEVSRWHHSRVLAVVTHVDREAVSTVRVLRTLVRHEDHPGRQMVRPLPLSQTPEHGGLWMSQTSYQWQLEL